MRKCIRARYSPIMPRANSCAPEKMATIEAKNAKPGTLPPSTIYRTITNARTPKPKKVKRKPITLANCNGRVLKPVIMFRAWVTSLRKV